MEKSRFIKKPFLTIVVVIFVVAAILYIESQKPKIIVGTESNKNTQTSQKTESTFKNPGDGQMTSVEMQKIINEKSTKYPKAPDFTGIEKWINSEPLSIEQLKGKVVLIDFWTYTCINCIRTLPYLKEWDKKYRDNGLVIIGVHTPEFEFEKKYENVLNAVNQYELKYPIAQDNNYATWRAYQNRYWPHKFLIDIDGYIRYDHIGEGGYEETEKVIQGLLKERMDRLNKNETVEAEINEPAETVDVNYSKIRTPEIYFGYQFSRGNFGNDEGLKPEQTIDYKMPSSIDANNIYLSGKWKNNADNMELDSEEGEIVLTYEARVLNIVAGSDKQSNISVLLDGKELTDSNRGNDIEKGSFANANEYKIYNLISSDNYDGKTIRIKVSGRGFKIYTFTFG